MSADNPNQNQHGSGAAAEEALESVLGVSFQNRSANVNRVVDDDGFRIPPLEQINPIPLNVSSDNSGEVSNISNQPSDVSDGAQRLPMGSAVLAGAARILGGGPYQDISGHKGKGRSSSPGVIRSRPDNGKGAGHLLPPPPNPLPPPPNPLIPPMPPKEELIGVNKVMEMLEALVKLNSGSKTYIGKEGKLEDKYFPTVMTFNGERNKFKEFLFELFVAIGRVDEKLGGLLRKWTKNKKGTDPEMWKAEEDNDLDLELYRKYSGELYGLLVSKTSGEPRCILTQMVDSGEKACGFKALVKFLKRFDISTEADLMRDFRKVLYPEKNF